MQALLTWISKWVYMFLRHLYSQARGGDVVAALRKACASHPRA